MTVKRLSEEVRSVAVNFDALGSELLQTADLMDLTARYNLQGKMLSLDRVAEASTVKLRSLAARMMEEDPGPVYEEAARMLGIRVEEEKCWVKIVVPAILPKKSVRENHTFLMRPLRHALLDFERRTPMERFGQCAVCIVHTYDAALGEARVRDYDNIETKKYLDVIESFFLTNDSGNACTVLQTTAMADRDETDFYIMLPSSLPGWVEQYVCAVR